MSAGSGLKTSANDSAMILPSLGRPERYENEWEGLRLVVEERPEHWQVFVFDPKTCEVIFTASRMSLGLAKLAAVEFVAIHVFGPRHGLNLETITVMLVWGSE
jgi:hypothetical protein